MNITFDELGVLNAAVEGLPNDAAQQASILAQLWTVVRLERTGNATEDPVRSAYAYLDQARALAAAANVKSTCGIFCVLVYHGSTLQQVVSGDSSLLDLWRSRTGFVAPSPQPDEVAEVTAEAVSNDPEPVVTVPEGISDMRIDEGDGANEE